MAETIRVLLGHPRREVFDQLRAYCKSKPALGLEIDNFARHQEGLEISARDRRPDIIVVDSSLLGFEGASSVVALHKLSGAAVVVVTEDPKSLAGSGVADTIYPPLTGDLEGTLQKLAQLARAQARRPLAAAPAGATAPDRVVPAAGVAAEKGVFVVWGVENGMGRQTVALNLATALAFQGKRGVIFVDMRRPYSSFRYHLPKESRLHWARSLYTLAENTPFNERGEPELDLDVIKHNVLPFYSADKSARLTIILGPVNERQAFSQRLSNERFIQALLAFLKKKYEYVIVSIGNDLSTDEVHLTAIHQADRLIVVTTPHEPYILLLKEKLEQQLSKLGLGRNNIDLVVNRYYPKHPVQISTITRALGLEAAAVLPEAGPELEAAIADEMPIMYNPNNHPGSEFVLEFKNFVNRYGEVYEVVKKPSSGRAGFWPFGRR